MGKRTVVPFGPQHPVLPEPIHLDFVIEDEHVVEALPSIGYVHRGLESLVDRREYTDFVYLAERICGICSFMHSSTFCQGVEGLMGIVVPERATYLRMIWGEYSRIHSHLLWLGLFADALGFESLFYNAWKIRESILNEFEATTGGRVIHGVCKVGGVRRDVTNEFLSDMDKRLEDIESDMRELVDVFLNDYTLKKRLIGKGILKPDDAYNLGAVGPVARGSGLPMDVRSSGYLAYHDIKFKPITADGCDGYARCEVRCKELFQSVDIIHQIIAAIPNDGIAVSVKGNPDGEYFSRSEQPRGEVIHYIRGNGTKYLTQFRVRTPTLTNVPSLIAMLSGAELADVPQIVMTIDPCIGCMER
ncbi:MAG TPA: nickel-dependent hydrogenase large subunit [Methanocorpusculum sp.]|nr:nickel-dependent hydrogenase large subunit [Methanocorpusculum sp.]HJK02460.1 nickel-dependent hydrogenase large subunit [Methanocorpusculum sp.]